MGIINPPYLFLPDLNKVNHKVWWGRKNQCLVNLCNSMFPLEENYIVLVTFTTTESYKVKH